MATTVANNVIRMTADNDTYSPAGKIKVRGVRLVSGSGAASTAQLRAGGSSGAILMSLSAAAALVDESQICFQCDAGALYLDLVGAGAEFYLYLE